MRRIVLTAVVVIVLIATGVAAAIYTGSYDVAADRPSWGPVAWVVNQARMRSVRAHAADISVPDGLEDQAKIAEGAGHFAQHCAGCHGAPGMKRSDVVAGLNPRSPSLTMIAKSYTPAELFWITKHGIKLSGMPAWIDHSDDEVWALVGFLQKLPGMKPQEFAGLIAAGRTRHDHQLPEAEPATGSAQPPAPPQPRSGKRRH
jgi:mono/diheme cytochrome c family protein